MSEATVEEVTEILHVQLETEEVQNSVEGMALDCE